MKIIAALLMSALSFAQVSGIPQPGVLPDGSALYARKCASCHGASGQGAFGPRLIGSPTGQLAILLRQGGGKGPHVKGMFMMDEYRATAIANYVKNLK